MSGRKHVPRPPSVFKQTSRASKLLALVPPINASSDVKNQTSSDEEVVISTCRLQDSDDLSSEAPSIPSTLENLDISEDDEDRNNVSGDEIPNSEPEDQELKKKGRGSYCQVVDNTNKIAIVKWYDNKVVTLISTYAEAYPLGKIKMYSKEMKARVDVDCPELIKHNSNHMVGVDLADMLVALYWTTYKSRRWYTAIFA